MSIFEGDEIGKRNLKSDQYQDTDVREAEMHTTKWKMCPLNLPTCKPSVIMVVETLLKMCIWKSGKIKECMWTLQIQNNSKKSEKINIAIHE